MKKFFHKLKERVITLFVLYTLSVRLILVLSANDQLNIGKYIGF